MSAREWKRVTKKLKYAQNGTKILQRYKYFKKARNYPKTFVIVFVLSIC